MEFLIQSYELFFVMALLMAKVPQNHWHATFTNNLYGLTKWLINSLAIKQNQPLLFASPTIIAHSAIDEKKLFIHRPICASRIFPIQGKILFFLGGREGVILNLFQNLTSCKTLKRFQGDSFNQTGDVKITKGVQQNYFFFFLQPNAPPKSSLGQC